MVLSHTSLRIPVMRSGLRQLELLHGLGATSYIDIAVVVMI